MKECVSIYDGTMNDDDLDVLLASTTQDGLMSKEDKIKLDSLTSSNGSDIKASSITQDSTHRFVTDTEKTKWNSLPSTKTDIGLGNVTNDAQVKRTEMGAANGVATLDESGLIPSSQLPGFVDDIEEASSVNSFPATGESDKLYVDTTENKTYRWSGTQYVEITSGGLTLGETSATAYAGDKGKDTTDNVNSIINGTTVVPKATDAATVNGHTVETNVPSDAVFTDTLYEHPQTHLASMITEDETHRFVTDNEKSTWDAKANTDVATTDVDGLMSSTDKTKLDGIEENANNYVHPETHDASIITEDETHRFVTDDEKSTWDAKADDIPKVPYYDESKNCVFACGVAVKVDASETSGKVKVSWEDETGTKSLEVNELVNIYGGGDGEEKTVFYPASCITMNSGYINSIFGGNLRNGTVGTSTVIVNGGSIKSGVQGGGAAYRSKSSTNTVGHSEVVINGSDNEILVVYGGGQGYATVGSTKVTVNGGSINYLTAAGSNGHTGIGEVTVNNGSIKVLQGCNRGTMGNIKLTVNGGSINSVYAGGEVGDSTVTATYTKSEVIINGGTITKASAGTYGGVENADRVSGTYVSNIIDDSMASAMNLSKVTTIEEIASKLITSAALEDKTLVLKNGETVIASVDFSSIIA